MNAFIMSPPGDLAFGILASGGINAFHERRELFFLSSLKDPLCNFAVAMAFHAGVGDSVTVCEEPGDFLEPGLFL